MAKARVSVIITCYNLERYLGEAIESVRAQTVQPLETIVIHDGCERPTMHDGTHTVFRQENRGVAESRDEGVRLAKGEWLLFLDADDCLAENFIEECLKQADRADIVYPNILLWSWWGEEAPKPNVWRKAPARITPQLLLRQNEVVVSSLMRRRVYEVVGGFDPQLPLFEDWDFWLKALEAGFAFRRADTYLKYRQRQNSRNHQREDMKQRALAEIRQRHQGHLKKRDWL